MPVKPPTQRNILSLSTLPIALVLALLFTGAAFAQNTVNANLFAAGWNDIAVNSQPTPWCPQDSTGAQATLNGFRMWDDGVKWGQIESCSVTNTCTTGTSANIVYDWTKMD